jgi:hypothetical protein
MVTGASCLCRASQGETTDICTAADSCAVVQRILLLAGQLGRRCSYVHFQAGDIAISNGTAEYKSGSPPQHAVQMDSRRLSRSATLSLIMNVLSQGSGVYLWLLTAMLPVFSTTRSVIRSGSDHVMTDSMPGATARHTSGYGASCISHANFVIDLRKSCHAHPPGPGTIRRNKTCEPRGVFPHLPLLLDRTVHAGRRKWCDILSHLYKHSTSAVHLLLTHEAHASPVAAEQCFCCQVLHAPCAIKRQPLETAAQARESTICKLFSGQPCQCVHVPECENVAAL